MIIVYVFLAFILFVILFIQQDMFGKTPSGERLDRIKKSSNFKEANFKI